MNNEWTSDGTCHDTSEGIVVKVDLPDQTIEVDIPDPEKPETAHASRNIKRPLQDEEIAVEIFDRVGRFAEAEPDSKFVNAAIVNIHDTLVNGGVIALSVIQSMKTFIRSTNCMQ